MAAADDWTWSYSRSRTLRECPRAFSYAIAPRERGASGSAVPLGAIIGICVHEAVDSFITRWSHGRQPSLHELRAEGERRFNTIWENRATTVVEFANGLSDESIQQARLRRAIRERLDRFYQFVWPSFRNARHECHEEAAEFEIQSHRVRFQIDFACWTEDGALCIVDWKTGGAANQRGGEVQLAVYSLWAHEKFNLEAHRIKPVIASLLNGRIIEYEVTPYDLDYVNQLVKEDYGAAWNYERRGSFPAYSAPDKCASCRYLRACPDGKEMMLGARS